MVNQSFFISNINALKDNFSINAKVFRLWRQYYYGGDTLTSMDMIMMDQEGSRISFTIVKPMHLEKHLKFYVKRVLLEVQHRSVTCHIIWKGVRKKMSEERHEILLKRLRLTQVMAKVLLPLLRPSCIRVGNLVASQSSCCLHAGSVFFRALLEAATSPMRNAVVTLIISSADFGMFSCTRLISSGLVIQCMNPEILMHFGSLIHFFCWRKFARNAFLNRHNYPRTPKEQALMVHSCVPFRYLHSARMISFSVEMFLHGNAFWGWVPFYGNSGLFGFYRVCSFPFPNVFRMMDMGGVGTSSDGSLMLSEHKSTPWIALLKPHDFPPRNFRLYTPHIP
nr:hypothetical protein [Tanacetum cinerariifolium]